MSGFCQYGELHDEALEMWMKLMQDKEITWAILLCALIEEFAHFYFIIVHMIQLWKIM